LWQATTFAERIASGALTSEFFAERRRLEGRIERHRTQHTEAVKDKSTAENKSRNLLEKLTVAETEKEDLSRRLVEEREGAEKACTEAQAARTEADAARAEASLTLKRAADVESGLKSLRSYTKKTEASTRAGVEWAHTLFVDANRELGTWTAPFDRSGEEVGLRFLGWLQEELESFPSIATASCPTPRLLPTRGSRMPCPVRDAGISMSSTGQQRTSEST
jgi:pyruvate-formate lyase